MARTSFETLPVDGPRDERSTSRVVNQAMTGKVNAVRDFIVPQTDLEPGELVTLKDSRLSAQSYVQVMPLNLSADVARENLSFSLPRKGEIDVLPAPISLQTGQAQAIDDGGILQTIGTTPTELLIVDDPNVANVNMTIGTTDITTNVFGTHFITFSGGGFSAGNVSIDVGVHIDPDGTATTDYFRTIEFARANNTFFSWSISLAASLQPGGLIAGVMQFSAIADLTQYGYILSVADDSGVSPLPITIDPGDSLGLGLNAPLEYRMLILG